MFIEADVAFVNICK